MPTRESKFLREIAGGFPRHPQQLNKILEADAELLHLPGTGNDWLVLKTDGIHEEIKTKLYEDPWLIGWMTVTAPVSDIAAVGAVPSGVLLSLVLSHNVQSDWLQQFKSGVQAACDKYNVYVLGGDTSYDTVCSASATVVANIQGRKPLLRSGIHTGDLLYASGLPGLGNASAYSVFFDASVAVSYLPTARLDAAALIRGYATACMDTSDGLFPSLAVLSEVNSIGFHLSVPLQDVLHPEAAAIHQQLGIPAWMLLAGPHGEYELLFTVPANLRQRFEQHCADAGWMPVLLGEATGDETVSFISGTMQVRCLPNTIPDLYHDANGNITTYYSFLQHQHAIWNNYT